MRRMTTDGDQPAVPKTPDPEKLRSSHSKYGEYLKKAGMPFEPEELDDEQPAASDAAAD